MDFLDTTFNILLIILGFGALIFVHELGHFLAAKWAGIRTEVFAIGMGPVMLSWRRGIGVVAGSTHAKVVARTGKAAHELSPEQLTHYGLGETEYSLRWLPIGGFVKMLGQDDTDPSNVSTDPRSYNVCPIGKRMVVVSAGVVANIVLAVILFVVAFMVGVRFEAPVVGSVSPSLPAGVTRADNAAELEQLGVDPVGLQPGDVVVSIDGKTAHTFADVQIASVMSKPGVPIVLQVRRAEVEVPLQFTLLPEKDLVTQLLSIGVTPGWSNVLRSEDDIDGLEQLLEQYGLGESGILPGMKMIAAAGREISTYQQFQQAVQRTDGQPVSTLWLAVDERGEPVGEPFPADIPVEPQYQILPYADPPPDALQTHEMGLLGLVPLVQIASLVEGSPNEGILHPGDVVLRVGSINAPRLADFRQEIKRHPRSEIPIVVLRDGEEKSLQATVDRDGMLNIRPAYATGLPLIARPMETVGLLPQAADQHGTQRTPAQGLHLFGGTRLGAVNDTPITDWASLRAALRLHTVSALAEGTGKVLELAITHPTPGRERETVYMTLSADNVADLHGLPWLSVLPSQLFEPVYTTLEAQGNPVRAAAMGFEETYKFIVLTYMTIDRLLRGSVGVEQLHGPVGIVHVGTKVADRGVTYLIFFLGIISVNLAVINFLPIPIVDGGLFLFLIYEKLKGSPPPLAFQNAATILGLVLIVTALLVVTFNDITRLLS